MSHAEAAMLDRWTGRRIITRSLQLAMVGVTPLLLYVVLGPADGNPIGLGLLAAVAVLVAKIGVLVGLLRLFGEHMARRGP